MNVETLEKQLLSGPASNAVSRHVLLPLLSSGTIAANADVLHIGCGTGRTTRSLADAFPGWRITALDSDATMIAKAFHRLDQLGERVKVTCAEPPELPYPDNSFDLVIAAHVWHRLADWQTVTWHTYRILRAGGAFVLTDVLAPRLSRRNTSAPHLPRLIELKVALTAAGFQITRCTEAGGLWYRILAHK